MAADVVDMLMDDHREVERLLGIMKEKPAQRPLMMPVVGALLIAHSRAEEAEVYPAARKEAGEADEVAEGREEHAQAEQLLEQLRAISDTSSKQFEQVLQKLEDAVQHHVQEEENDVLPGMRKQLDNKRRQQLGEAFAARRATEIMPAGGRGNAGGKSKGELYEEAKRAGVSGRSSMNKEQLAERLEKK